MNTDKWIKYRWAIISATLLLTLDSSVILFRIKVDPDLKNYFPSTMTSMVNTDRIEEVFGSQEMVMLVFETKDILDPGTLERLRHVVREMERMDGISNVASLFGSNRIYGEAGVMYVEPTVLRIPGSNEEREALRRVIRENDLVYKVLVSEDFTATGVVARLRENADEDVVFNQLNELLRKYPGPEKVHFGGLPYLRQAIDHDIKRDGITLIPSALFLMLIFLFAVFREWRGVWLPFLVVVISSVLALSLIPLLGWKFYLITLLVPILLIAVANDYGIHMMARYQELNARESRISMKELAIRITMSLWKPVLLTGLTTIAGISALGAHTMIPARQMALVAGTGILLALLLSLTLLPSILSLLPPSRPVSSLTRRTGRMTMGPLQRFAGMVIRRSRLIPIIFSAITLLFAAGIFFLRVDSNEENFFPDHHPVKESARLINKKLGGSENISVMFTGDMLDPEVLKRMEKYREKAEKMDAIDFTLSFSGIIREISKALNDKGDSLYDRIPPTREAVAQYMELYSMNGDPDELEQLVDFDYRHALLMIRINDASNETIGVITKRLEAMLKGDPAFACIGGYGTVRAELADRVLRGTFYSLGIAFVAIFFLLALIFRSFEAGLLGIIPLFLSMVLLFGLMGWSGVKLDVATALISSMMIGVGIDYTIHFLWRFREERSRGLNQRDAVFTSLTTTGRGILFNALSVIVGFSVLTVSSFTPIRFFGILVVVSILSCLAGAVILLPAILLRFRPRFLEPGRSGLDREDGKTKRMGMTKRIAVLIPLLAVMAAGARGEDPPQPAALADDARAIIGRSHEVSTVSSFEAQATLTITDQKGNERIRQCFLASLSSPDGTVKRILRFLSPPEVRGTGILIFDYPEKSDDMWIYLPALRKIRRVVSREKSRSFMGSEFSNANLSAPGLEDFGYRLEGEELLNGHACYRISSVPVSEELKREYGYERSVSWVDKKSYLVYQVCYYGFDDELFKTISNLEFSSTEGEDQSRLVTRMHAVNHRRDRTSDMVLQQVTFKDVDESRFTPSYLERE